MKRQIPYYFLVFLIIIIAFIFGLQRGQKIERTNKTIDYLISLTPRAPSITPTAVPQSYSTYIQKTCGISFLFPDSFKRVKETSDSAVFDSSAGEAIALSCPKAAKPLVFDSKTATASISFKNQKLTAKQMDDSLTFQLRNPRSGGLMTVTIQKYLLPLFESTLQYL